VETSTGILAGLLKKMGVTCSFKYKCEGRRRKTAWKVLYLSKS